MEVVVRKIKMEQHWLGDIKIESNDLRQARAATLKWAAISHPLDPVDLSFKDC